MGEYFPQPGKALFLSGGFDGDFYWAGFTNGY